VDPETQAVAARMIEDQIRDEWVKIGGTADCRAIVHYHEQTDGWEAWPARDDLTVNDRRAFVTAVNRVIHHHKMPIKVKLAPPL
jgi:hypothetical protein